MTAALKNRDTYQLAGAAKWPANLTIKDNEILFAGVMLALDATPEVVEASDTSGIKVLGRNPEEIDNTDDGEVVCPDLGIFKYENDGSNPVVEGDRVCYVKDDITVCATAGSTNKIVAGLVFRVDSDGVWVVQTIEALNVAQALHDLGDASATAHIADVAAVTQDALTLTSMTGTANTAPAAETNLGTLTLTSMTGTANTTPVAETNIDTIGGTLTGTLDNTLADVTGSWDATAIATINKNFKEVQAELVTQKALNTVLVNDAKLFAEQLVIQKALNTVLVNDAKTFATQLNAVRVDNAAQVTKINAILTALEAQNVVKSA